MPLAFSMSIQSDTVARRPALPWTAPASVMARACSASASVSVDLPASGWLMTAKVRRRPVSAEIRPGGEVSAVGGAARALSVIAPVMVLAPEYKPVIGAGRGGHPHRDERTSSPLNLPTNRAP